MTLGPATRLVLAACAALVVCEARAAPFPVADATYLQLPGVSGPSAATRYTGWFDVAYQNVVLVPGSYEGDRKTVSSNCTATVRTALGAAGATVAELVGTAAGNVRIETVSSAGLRHHQVVLRNAVLVQQVMSFENGLTYDLLSFRFEAADLTTYDVKPDGSRGSGTQGSFDCLIAR